MIKRYGMPSNISFDLLYLLQFVYPRIEAEIELRKRYVEGPLTPDLAYDLINAAYEDPVAALNAKMQIMLSQMKEPSK
jgi:hypothetical protein